MEKNTEKLVKKISTMTSSLDELTQDQINKVAPKPAELEPLPLSLKERAKLEGARYLEPLNKMPPIGKLKPEWQKMHDYDWEYVCGSYQPGIQGNMISTEPMKFWFCKWPGDPDCYWDIPINVKVYVPRMIAKYLSGEIQDTGLESMKYHKFDYVKKPEHELEAMTQAEKFMPVQTLYTGRFVASGTF